MVTFRPAVKEDDGYVQKKIKYILTEIIAGYTSLAGYLAVEAQANIPDRYKTYYITLLIVLAIVTPIWT
jgi:hypothetical protein